MRKINYVIMLLLTILMATSSMACTPGTVCCGDIWQYIDNNQDDWRQDSNSVNNNNYYSGSGGDECTFIRYVYNEQFYIL